MTEERRLDTLSQLGSGALRSTLPESSQPCDLLNEDEILGYVRARLGSVELSRIGKHVRVCRTCQFLVHEALCLEHPRTGPSEEAWAANANFAPGVLLAGRYLIRGFLGKGAMGEVYEALDNVLGQRSVALKTVVASASDSPRAQSRLRDEVVLAQRISHPNVCRIHNLEVDEDGDPLAMTFLTMEFIEGEGLGRRLRKRGALGVEEARRIARQLLHGLQAAHEAQVLHRDFKSDNVMLRTSTTPAQAVITDFGLARALDPSDALAYDSRHLVGTIPYMSPEQLHGDKLGPASDLFAFGVVLYEMLTGRLPFKGGVRTPPAAPSQLPGVSASLDAFVLKCLSLEAKDRYASAELALSDLERVSRRPRVRRRWAALAFACVVAALVGLVQRQTISTAMRLQALSVAAPAPSAAPLLPPPRPAAPPPAPDELPRAEPSGAAAPQGDRPFPPRKAAPARKLPGERVAPARAAARGPAVPPADADVRAGQGVEPPASDSARTPREERLLDPFEQDAGARHR